MFRANEDEQGVASEHRRQIDCDGCPYAGPSCGTRGDVDAPIVFVGESPGMQEIRKGVPLVGPSGNIFNMNVPASLSVYILNAMECMPKTALKNDNYMTRATNCCHDNLVRKIKSHPRKIIVTMGNWATRSILGDASIKITQVRGKLYDSPLAEVGVMPIIHMAALMRGTGSYRQWQRDIAYALDLGTGKPVKEYIECKPFFVPSDVASRYVDLLIERLPNEVECDLETSSLDYYSGYILQCGITDLANRRTLVFGPSHIQMLKKHFENPLRKWAFHNGKFDVKWLRKLGIEARVDDDTMLMSYALDEDAGIHGLESVAGDLLGAPDYKDMLKPWLPNRKTSYAAVPYDVLGKYLALDCGNTTQIRSIMRERIRRDNALEKLYTQTLIPASEYLTWIEYNGAFVDQEQLHQNDVFYTQELAVHKEAICSAAGYSINPGSPQQIKKLLYTELGYPNRFKGSTAIDVIDKLQKIKNHPVLEHLQLYRKAVKMHGTYIKGWQKHIGDDGRIHCTYKIHGTRTGRLSSSEPNMQNIPRLARIKDQLGATPGYTLIEIDYSQAELRVLAALSNDPVLCSIFSSCRDLHTDLANEIYPGYDERIILARDTEDKELAAACKEERTKCKNVNFGIMFGITKFGLSALTKDTPAEAQSMLDAWFNRYPVAGLAINKWRNTPINNQVITTCFGRKKRVGIVSHANLGILQNEASNFPPQSIASDFTLHAGIRSRLGLKQIGCRIVNTVHDSIIFEVPNKSNHSDVMHKAITLVRTNMEAVPKDYGLDQVPFKTDVDIGTNWGSLQKYM